MANEITVSASLTVKDANGKPYVQEIFPATSFNQAAVGGPTPGYITVGTTEESTAFPELTTEGWLFMKNLDATNYVQWGFATTVYGGRLEPGEVALFRMEPSVTLYLKANTAACKVLVMGCED